MFSKYVSYSYKYTNKIAGFTLVELMVSLVLGLLISAAVIQVYLANVKTATIQSAGSDIIDSSIFGIPQLEEHLRLANLGLADSVTLNSNGAGIILSADNLKGIKLSDNSDGTAINASLLTNTGDMTPTGTKNQWSGISNVNVPSGQITIQFRAPQKMYDCEGNIALGPRQVTINGVKQVIDGQVVVERYYLNAADSSKPNDLSLYCDAGKYITESMDNYQEQGDSNNRSTVLENKNILKDFGDKGEMITRNIDYFDFLLKIHITKTDSTTKLPVTTDYTRYFTVKDYKKLLEDATKSNTTKIDSSIQSIKIAAIVHSNKAAQVTSGVTNFPNILGQNLVLKDGIDTNQKYLRVAFQREIALRNARLKNIE